MQAYDITHLVITELDYKVPEWGKTIKKSK